MNLSEISTPALAYLGDSVIELLVREHLVNIGISSSRRLNDLAGHYVRAGAQATAVRRILGMLTEEENDFYKRGRNIGHTNVPKSASVTEYREATGMEVLFGYLHISGQTERARELFAAAYPEN